MLPSHQPDVPANFVRELQADPPKGKGDHFNDDYHLEQIMVDPDNAPASILRLLADSTDGRLQPVAAFSCPLEGFLPPIP